MIKKTQIRISYSADTSKTWRKIGDSLLAACLLVMPFMNSDTKFTRILAIFLIIGKFVTSFFAESESENKEEKEEKE